MQFLKIFSIIDKILDAWKTHKLKKQAVREYQHEKDKAVDRIVKDILDSDSDVGSCNSSDGLLDKYARDK